ncbi:MAG TPA: RNA polymerase sigma factor SigJ [Gemmatimonadaceae bacterium]|nr:RNA polymerase sigma factor SigJ [Gemmatimonadaceae bacterium]
MREPAPDSAVSHRPRLLGLAYRMLGDVDEAEDVVQEALLRWHLADQEAIRVPEAWLVTVVTRLAVDRLRRLKTERASYPGPWLPEPIRTDGPFAPSPMPSPDRRAELSSDLSVALLLLLERLAPEERAAFLLRDVFDFDYADIARILERSADAVRQMVSRARTRVQQDRARVQTDPGEHERLLERFLDAVIADDAAGVMALLAPDVVLAGDGGGRAAAARNVIRGCDHVARFLLGVRRKFAPSYSHRIRYLNGEPALVSFDHAAVISTMSVVVSDGRIEAIHIMRNPDKLGHVLASTVLLR